MSKKNSNSPHEPDASDKSSDVCTNKQKKVTGKSKKLCEKETDIQNSNDTENTQTDSEKEWTAKEGVYKGLDQVTKATFGNKEYLADLLNAIMFDGYSVIKENNIMVLQTETPFPSEWKITNKDRDIFVDVTINKDHVPKQFLETETETETENTQSINMKFIIGIENQREAKPDMLIRAALYDILNYYNMFVKGESKQWIYTFVLNFDTANYDNKNSLDKLLPKDFLSKKWHEKFDNNITMNVIDVAKDFRLPNEGEKTNSELTPSLLPNLQTEIKLYMGVASLILTEAPNKEIEDFINEIPVKDRDNLLRWISVLSNTPDLVENIKKSGSTNKGESYMGSIFEDYANERIAVAVAEKDEVIRKQQEEAKKQLDDTKKQQEDSIIKLLKLKNSENNDALVKQVFNITDEELQRIKEKYKDSLK